MGSDQDRVDEGRIDEGRIDGAGQHEAGQPELSEADLAERRRAKFGALPPRITASEMVETADTGAAIEEPAEPAVRREWG
jgi:hypothetical protein